MDAKGLWKAWAMSDEGQELAAELAAVEDDALDKLAKLDHKITAALAGLAEKMDNKPLVAKQKCKAETLYRSRFFEDHIELSIKLPVEMVMELAEMWSHYEDHSCPDAASALDAFTKTILDIMVESVPSDVVMSYLGEDDEDDES